MRDRFGKFIYCGRYLIRVEEETVESDGNEDREMSKRTTLRAKMKTKMETDDGDETFNNVRGVYGMGPAPPWVTEQRPGPPLVGSYLANFLICIRRCASGRFFLLSSSCRAKCSQKLISKANLLDLSRGSCLLFICYERPLHRRSKWIQVLITLQGE